MPAPWNATTVGGAPPVVAGPFTTAVQFDGATQYMYIPNAAWPVTATTDYWTVELWVRTTQSTGTMVAIGSNGPGSWWIGTINGAAHAALSTGTLTGPAIADGAWHALRLTVAGGLIAHFWVDGADQGQIAVNITSVVVTQMAIARLGNTGTYWNGAIAEVALYHYAMPPGSYVPASAAYANNVPGINALYHLTDASGSDTAQSSLPNPKVVTFNTATAVALTAGNNTWVAGTTSWVIAAGSVPGSVINSQSCSGAPPAGALNITPGASSGTVGLRDSTNGTTAMVTVAAPTMAASPTTVPGGTSGQVITLSGHLTQWQTLGSTFGLSGNPAMTKVSQSITSDTSATITVNIANGSAGDVLISDDKAVDSATVTVLITVPLTDPNLTPSPYNWFKGVGYLQTNDPGAYLKFGVAGTRCALFVDMSTYAGQVAVTLPQLAYSVDGATPVVLSPTASTQTEIDIPITSAGNHSIVVWVKSLDRYFYRYANPPPSGPFSSFRINSIGINAGTGLIAPTGELAVQPNLIVCYGDSIGEGLFAQDGTDNALYAWPRYLADFVSAEYGAICFGGQGYSIGVPFAGDGTTPDIPPEFTPGNDALSAWNKQWQSQTRLVAGKFSPVPTAVYIVLGTNDGIKGATDAATTAAVSGLITALRGALGASTPITVFVPFGQFKHAAIAAGVAAAGDAHTRLIDLGSFAARGLSGPFGTKSLEALDSIHPVVYGNYRVAAAMAAAVGATGGGGGGGGGAQSVLFWG